MGIITNVNPTCEYLNPAVYNKKQYEIKRTSQRCLLKLILINLQNKINGFNATDIYGPNGKTKIKKKLEKKKNPKLTMKQSIFVVKGMLEFCTCKDLFMLILGLVCAIINGMVNPVSAIILGKVVNIILEIIFTREASKTLTEIVINGSHFNETYGQPYQYNYDPYTPDVNSGNTSLSNNAFYYLIVGVISLTCAFTEIYCWEVTCETIVVRLRKKFLSQVLRQDLEWFDKAETGDLSTRLTDDLERVRDGFGAKVALLLQLTVMILSGFGIGLYLDWRFALVLSIATPVLFFNAILASSITAQTAVVEQIKYSEAGAIASEVLSGIRTVAAFGGETNAKARYDKALDEGRKLTLNKYYGLAIAISVNYGSLMLMYSLGLLYGSYLYIWGLIDIGTMTSVFSCLIQAAFTAALCLPILVDIGTALGAAASVIPIIQRIPSIDPYSDHGKTINNLSGEIKFEDVKFAYPTRPQMLVLKGMNLKIPAGKIVALVGSSGAGKSTIVNLLMHFYSVTSGRILFDGVNVKDLNLKWLRKQVGIVSQEPVLFRVSIAENIRYGREDATMADIITAAKQANAHNFIMSLPEGYETEVGDKGMQISGGQKQRIAIARALVKDPKILLLDEATSALDSQSEAIVQEALDNAMQGRTTIIIAHRLSTVRNAHLICAMQDGIVEEVGTHESLMDKRGLYYDLVMLQSQLQEESPVDEEEEIARKLSFSRKLSMYSTRSSVCSTAPEIIKEKSHYKALFLVKGTPWLRISIGLIFFFACGLAEPSLAYVYTQAVKAFLITDKEEFKREITIWVGALGGIGLCMASFLLFGVLLCATSTERMIQVFRVQMFTNMLSQQASWFDYEENAPNRVTNLLAREPPLVKGMLGGKFGMLVKCSLNISLAVILSYVCSWKLAFITLFVFTVIIFSSFKSLRLQVRAFQKESNIVQIGFKLATECIQNIKTVQQIGLQELLINRYVSMVDNASKTALKQALFYGTAYTLSSALVIFLNSGLCQFGNMLLRNYDIPPNNLLMLIFLASFTCPVIPVFAHFFNEFAKAMDPIKRVSTMLDLKDENFNTFSEDGVKPELKGRIEFSNVKFTYPLRPEAPILKGLNLTIEPGQTVALVGPSGCGKSTTISLLERFYSPSSGSIKIDDYRIKDLHLGYLRSNIGLVTQEPTLFDCSIRRNISYGLLDREATDSEVIEAAKKANIHDFITTLPKGYDTPVGDKGAQMSGGQKQRIAIARALIRDPKILLLDEATSALDNQSEKIVQEALERAQEGRTCIIIAHRLSTVQNADKILVISNGKVVEEGTHSQLIRAEGLYFDMVNRQQNRTKED